MSLVGPRPALPCEVATYDSLAMRRLTVPQGVTCTWQISGRSRVSFDEWMRLDTSTSTRGIRSAISPSIAKTIPAVIRRRGAHRPHLRVVPLEGAPRPRLSLASSTLFVMAATFASALLGFAREVVNAKFYGTQWKWTRSCGGDDPDDLVRGL